MAEDGYFAHLRLVRGFFGEFMGVLRGRARPKRLILHYNRAIMAILGIYTNKKLMTNTAFKVINRMILINMVLFTLPIICGVTESSNVIDIGDDLVFIIGICLILCKVWYITTSANDVDDVIKDFDHYLKVFRPNHNNEKIWRLHRICFLIEGVGLMCFGTLLTVFNTAIAAQPLFGSKELPYHVIYPFEIHLAAKHPVTHWIIFVMQFFVAFHNLMSIMEVDLLGVNTFMQTALNLKILCLELQDLGNLRCSDEEFKVELYKLIGFHQHIIGIVEKINNIFYGCFIFQMIASFAMISVSTFETMVAVEDPEVAAKFVLFMVTVFVQLSYWCVAGTLVYSQSLEVAQAAFDIKDWHNKSPSIQRDIMFVIQRSQTPLVYQASPFPPYTLTTYTMILTQCYRILALLSESVE